MTEKELIEAYGKKIGCPTPHRWAIGSFTWTLVWRFAYVPWKIQRELESRTRELDKIKGKQKELFYAMELWRQENLPPEQLIEPEEEWNRVVWYYISLAKYSQYEWKDWYFEEE